MGAWQTRLQMRREIPDDIIFKCCLLAVMTVAVIIMYFTHTH